MEQARRPQTLLRQQVNFSLYIYCLPAICTRYGWPELFYLHRHWAAGSTGLQTLRGFAPPSLPRLRRGPLPLMRPRAATGLEFPCFPPSNDFHPDSIMPGLCRHARLRPGISLMYFNPYVFCPKCTESSTLGRQSVRFSYFSHGFRHCPPFWEATAGIFWELHQLPENPCP